MYIEEAHPTDGWMYQAVRHHVAQHTTLAERCDAAQLLAAELGVLDAPDVPLVVDGLDNRASLAYGALPERLVILQEGTVVFIGGKGPEEYSIEAARRALEQLLAG